ncbi:MAG: hypothetical protein EXX96DRAFT_570380 [Benjaminiella poitrasii]|nr:MAG: hypothetical protein EXX96DRAFT_570380 [Benjaminiella poitrasii]
MKFAGFFALAIVAFSFILQQVLAVTSCSCNGTVHPVVGDMCICGQCDLIVPAYNTYIQQCPDSKFADLERYFGMHCKNVENTEDCEFFKKLPGEITDAYKRCKDDFDSIHDDCENCAGCSF